MNTKYFSLVALFLLFLVGCKKFVDVAPPPTLVSTTNLFKTSQSAIAAQLGIYTTWSSYTPYNVARRTGTYVDELTNYDTGLPFSLACYRDQLTPMLNISSWTEFYGLVYQANSAISGLNASTAIPISIKSQLIGEAKFSRAFFYFYLVNLFGDVPMPLSTDYKVNSLLSKIPKSQVYQQIVMDLKSADSLLNSNFVDAATMTTTTDRIRPTKWAAEAMLARVDLYLGDYTNADALASQVIANTSLFKLNSDLNGVFLQNSSEAIFQLQDQTNNSYMQEGNNFILGFYLNTYGESNSSALSQQLLNAFEAGDRRRVDWVGVYNDFSGNTYYYPYKYKQGYTTTPTENETVLRLSEQYLIRAEARAQKNDINGAVSDLNVIRGRAGLPTYAGSIDKTSVLTAILHERQVEFFCEWGHRFFDLKRSGTINAVMNIAAQQKNGLWATYKQYWPIPQSDINKNSNLIQNTGY